MTDQSFTFSDRFINREKAIKSYGSLAEHYGRLQLVGDALADDLVATCRTRELDVHRLLEGALAAGIDSVSPAPAAMVALFGQLDEAPPWLDPERLDLGARTYQRLGPAAMIILSSWSLMNGYRCAPAVKPLAFTGALTKRAPRRLAETSRFVTEVCQVGGMNRDRPGFHLAVRVRVMHAMVRRMLAASVNWDRRAWGTPINQSDMAGTVIEFSLNVLAGARRMGFHFSPDEADAIVHLWRYCGYLSGVDDALLDHFSNEATAIHFATMAASVQPGPDADSIALARALRSVPVQMAHTPREKRFSGLVTRYHDGLTWVFNGDDGARELGIPNRRWKYAIYPTRALIAPLELARRTIPGLHNALVRAGNRAVRRDVDRMLNGSEPTFGSPRATASTHAA